MPTFLFWFVLPLLRYLVKERYPRFLEKNNESQIKVSQKLNADSLLRWEKAFVVNLLFTGNIYNYIYYVLINLVCNSLIHFLQCLISTFLNREKKILALPQVINTERDVSKYCYNASEQNTDAKKLNVTNRNVFVLIHKGFKQ